jgi:hypothetical protein
LNKTSEISDALEIVATLEARLGYAQNLAGATQPDISQNLAAAPSAHTQDTPGERADPVALLILRNLPESVTFSSGSPVGKGAWAMAAGDPNQLTMTLGDGFDKPVNADVEMISHAGLPLGTIRLALRKDGAAPATAEIPPETQAAMTEADDAEPARPGKRTRHVHTHNLDKIADAKTGHKKRVKRVAHPVKSQTTDKAAGKTTGKGNAQTTDTPDETDDKDPPDTIAKTDTPEKKPGPLTKLFSWLKGGAAGSGTATEPSADTRNPASAMFPQ